MGWFKCGEKRWQSNAVAQTADQRPIGRSVLLKSGTRGLWTAALWSRLLAEQARRDAQFRSPAVSLRIRAHRAPKEENWMPAWICVTCGVQHAESLQHPERCDICEDERQYVGWGGQLWTTMDRLASDHATVLREEEPDLVGIGVEPSFAIGQRALLVKTPHGNVLWDCISLLDDHAYEAISAHGGIDAVCISHPHFYAANVEFADAFDATIFLPRADQNWIRRPSPRIELYDDQVEPAPGLTLARIGGHFDGAAVLHWADGADGAGALLTGDTVTVVQDREWVSFMWSYPNLIPLDAATVLDVADRVGQFNFDRVYGGWWGRVVLTDGAGAIRRSADRYVARIRRNAPAIRQTRRPD